MSKSRREVKVRAAEHWDEGVRLEQGHAASTVAAAGDDDEYFAAMLYLPDPESRSGYQLHGVKRQKAQVERGGLGFGRHKP